MKLRSLMPASLLLGAVFVGSCGGQISDSFANSVYIQIKGTGALQPINVAAPNNFRIVFINDDAIPHTINWSSPITLTATAPPGGRAWFDLPALLPGTVLNYHLDASGPAGTVAIMSPQ